MQFTSRFVIKAVKNQGDMPVSPVSVCQYTFVYFTADYW
nr:MAG TPA: hypothetical protein [Caudoviricetes sp.]